ncbi:MAG: short-chain fatty acid transporter [Planctomycetes bacterium]|nr:short-chain fatty acid transporter [Planctomycetota bacterium]
MLRRISEGSAAWARRWVPDPFVLAVLLTALTFAAALAAGAPWATLVEVWGGKQGVWKPALMEFTLQMILVLVTGHALASTRPVRRAIDALARRPTTPRGAVALTAFVACAAGLLNWGLGLVVGALLARQVGASCRARGVRIHYPLVVAAGYAGMLVWHGGLSGSAPLKVTQASDVLAVVGDPAVLERVGALVAARAEGFTDGAIPLSLTLLGRANLVACALALAVVPALFALMAPARDAPPEALQEIDPALARAALEDDPGDALAPATPAARLEASRLVPALLVALGAGHLALRGAREGPLAVLQRLDLDTLNLAFLLLGLALHGSARAYARAVAEAIPGAAGIVLQFPLYFGIMALMSASGLVVTIAEAMVALSRGAEWAYPTLTFLSAGLVNFFVPSGGGQWAIQGPIVLRGAAELGVDPGRAVMALAYGDQWTNLAQPFWALPLLGICGVRAGDIMGYTLLAMALSLPVFLGPLLLL